MYFDVDGLVVGEEAEGGHGRVVLVEVDDAEADLRVAHDLHQLQPVHHERLPHHFVRVRQLLVVGRHFAQQQDVRQQQPVYINLQIYHS